MRRHAPLLLVTLCSATAWLGAARSGDEPAQPVDGASAGIGAGSGFASLP